MGLPLTSRAMVTLKLLARNGTSGLQASSRLFRDFTAFESEAVRSGHPLGKVVVDARPGDWKANHPIRKTVFESGFAAEKISQIRPSKVHDVGSYHEYIATLSSFVDVTVVDTRKLQLDKKGLSFVHGDARNLPFSDGECEFFTSLCVVPHVGLGRYGDKIDSQGDIQFLREVYRCLKPGGHFVASMIVASEPVLVFNAQRVYDIQQADDLVSQFILEDEIFIHLANGVLLADVGRDRLARGQHDYKDYLVRVVCLRKPE